jgi:hypothetical protein
MQLQQQLERMQQQELQQQEQQQEQQPFRHKQTKTEPAERQRVRSISLYFLQKVS